MAEVAEEVSQIPVCSVSQQPMDLPNHSKQDEETINDESNLKRPREEKAQGMEGDDFDSISKKPNSQNSLEEQQLQAHDGDDERGGDEESDVEGEGEEVEEYEGEEEEGIGNQGQGDDKESVSVALGPKIFGSSMKMLDYFVKLLHYWPHKLNFNKYEYLVLLDLLNKGQVDHDKKIEGVNAFQVRYHPTWNSKCFFAVKEDGSSSDFSFRKCIDKILPLPDHMKKTTNAGIHFQRGGRGHYRGGRGAGNQRGGRGHFRGRRGGFRM